MDVEQRPMAIVDGFSFPVVGLLQERDDDKGREAVEHAWWWLPGGMVVETARLHHASQLLRAACPAMQPTACDYVKVGKVRFPLADLEGETIISERMTVTR